MFLYVSILVLMEVFRPDAESTDTYGGVARAPGSRFNPCSDGSVSTGQLPNALAKSAGRGSFNPCSDGSVSTGSLLSRTVSGFMLG